MFYNMTILDFRLPYFHVSNSALFLHSTLVLSFYIDVALTLSIWFGVSEVGALTSDKTSRQLTEIRYTD